MKDLQINVLIADDQTLFREYLKSYLGQKGFWISADVGDGFQAVAKALALRPDVVLMDLQMELIDGVRAARTIKENNSEIKIIAITCHGDYLFYNDLRNCFDGYLKKPVALEIIEDAILRVHNGKNYFYDRKKEKEKIIDNIENYSKIDQKENGHPLLTNKEKQIAKYIFDGLCNAEIAEKFSITISTVNE